MTAFDHAAVLDRHYAAADTAITRQVGDALTKPTPMGQDFVQQIRYNGPDVSGYMGKVELVQGREALPPGDMDLVQRGVRALLADARNGEQFSPDSVAAFQKIYQEASSRPGATPESIAAELNAVGAAINQRVSGELSQIPGRRPEPIGIGVSRNEDGSANFFMMISKDSAALARNRLSIISGTPSPSVLKLGPFKPGTPT